MPKAGENLPPSQEPPKQMPKGKTPTTTSAPGTIEPPTGGAAVSTPIPATPPEINTPNVPNVPNVPSDLDRKDPF
jgi:hypothetical protein